MRKVEDEESQDSKAYKWSQGFCRRRARVVQLGLVHSKKFIIEKIEKVGEKKEEKMLTLWLRFKKQIFKPTNSGYKYTGKYPTLLLVIMLADCGACLRSPRRMS